MVSGTETIAAIINDEMREEWSEVRRVHCEPFYFLLKKEHIERGNKWGK